MNRCNAPLLHGHRQISCPGQKPPRDVPWGMSKVVCICLYKFIVSVKTTNWQRELIIADIVVFIGFKEYVI